MLIPSIDLLDGKAVQLQMGNPNQKKVEIDNVKQLLEEFSLLGEVAIIDLNAALGKGDNKALIKELLAIRPCRVGGGIRDYETAREYLAAGARKIIMGTACQNEFVKKLPKSRLIFAIDAIGDSWTTDGWTKQQDANVIEVIHSIQENCSEFLYTQVKNEGLLNGLDKDRIESVLAISDIPVTIAGGISNLDDIRYINQKGANAQIGMALYTGVFKLQEAFFECLDFEKQNLIPTVVQDIDTQKVLMLAYSSADSLLQAISQRKGVYFSRSRKEIWQKGLTSGNTQELINIDYDCDGDTLLFQVKQKSSACHLQRYSCFASQTSSFDISTLDKVIAKRKSSIQTSSYTSRLLSDPNLQNEKLLEECNELIEAESYQDVQWEAADLIYFALVNAQCKGVPWKSIVNELGARSNV